MLIALDPTKREREKKVDVYYSNLRIRSPNRNKLKVKFTWELRNMPYAICHMQPTVTRWWSSCLLSFIQEKLIVRCAMCDVRHVYGREISLITQRLISIQIDKKLNDVNTCPITNVHLIYLVVSWNHIQEMGKRDRFNVSEMPSVMTRSVASSFII